MAGKLCILVILIYTCKAQLAYSDAITIGCDRQPTDFIADKLDGDNGFRLRFHRHPAVYERGNIYRVSIASILPTSFIGFMLTASDATDVSRSVGTFELLDSRGSMFAPFCTHAVTHTSNMMRTRIGFRWTAPSGDNAPCVLFRAVVVQSRGVWYRDEGDLSLQICPEVTWPSTTPVEPANECCAPGSAKYHMTFVGTWSRLTHPKDYPPDYINHWSPFVGATHSKDYVIWEYGGYSTTGVKEVAEWGSASAMENEIKEQVKVGNVRTAFRTKGLWPARGNMSVTFSTDASHPYVSGLTMIGPSPDWNLGISNVNMCMDDCTWLDQAEFDLLPWDAGTDSGVTYMSANSPTNPQEPIREITSLDSPQSPFYDPSGSAIEPLAKLYIEKICRHGTHCSTNTNTHDSSSGGMMKKPSMMSPKMMKTMPPKKMMPGGEVTMPPKNMHGGEVTMPPKNMGGDGVIMPPKKNMPVTMPPKIMPPKEDTSQVTNTEAIVDCMMSEWSPWSECTKTCGKGKMSRTRMVKLKPRNGGEKCGKKREKKTCNLQPCSRDCKMSKWSRWSECSSSCGEPGMMIRTRRVIEEQIGDGKPCSAVMGEKMCKPGPCPLLYI
ncbi:spondin-1-like [Antedon mediterranea]|uniref:spondin-1-like n=1 Tax=Antedon mediterranea TaxID=105859 RepID=UPI003AF4334F